MKSISQALRDSLGIKLTAFIFALALTGNVHAQEQIQPETDIQLPAKEIELKEEDKTGENNEQDDKQDNTSGATTPSDLQKQDAAPPANLQESGKLPAVQEDKLPAVQKDKLPAVQQPSTDINKQTPGTTEIPPGPDRPELPAVQEPHPISDDPVDAPYADSDALPDGAGMPDTGGPADGGFVPKASDIDPEVAFGDLPRWTRIKENLEYGGGGSRTTALWCA